MKKILVFIKRHKILTAIILAIFIIAVGWPTTKKVTAKPEQKYETAKVQKEDLTDIVSASGTIQAENQVDLKFQTSGLLTWVGVKEGDQVKKWQAIASLDKRELEKNLLKTLRDYSSERNDFEEESQVTYKDELLTNTVRRILEKNQWDLDKAVVDVEIKDLAIKLASLVSPIEGIVTHIDTPVAGVNITPATAVFTIANPAKMKLVANVDESDIGKVKVGQKVILTLDTYPDQEIEGEVGKIAFASIATKGGGTAYPIEIYLPENKELQFKVGMNGDLEIIIARVEDVLNVPSEAITEKDGKKFIRVIEGRQIKEVEVETGLTTDIKTQITKGLTEGETIIVRAKTK
ncbi:efflux RND transporter periplasmic adaptor subunit [Patescibacteria group bacterium]|nr:efflux RND transporter periplasmic adaptor subunit [Patescibacteria group bacterium]